MSLFVFLSVIASSFFQAWWNFHLKKVKVDKSAFLIVGWLFFGIVSTPLSFLFIDKSFDSSWWHFVLGTGLIQGLYLVTLSTAYQVADISLIFPLARGLSVSLTTMALSFFASYVISPSGVLGIALVVAGSLCLAFRELKNKKSRTGLLLALVLAILVSSYSVLDSFGAQKIPIVFYVLVMNVSAPLFALPWLYRSKKEHFVQVYKNHLWLSVAVAFAGSAAYLIVVWAFTQAPAPYVLALRETSIVFATLMGVVYLKEPISKNKAIGIFLIILGILFIKIA